MDELRRANMSVAEATLSFNY